jgi:RNA polymerase sigma factor (sigma-70 family)
MTVMPLETRTRACVPRHEDIRLFLQGDRESAERLARDACQLALRSAAAIMHDRDEARDVAQDVAADVLQSLSQLRNGEAFESWVHRITVRHVLRRLRGRHRRRASEFSLALLTEADEPVAAMDVDPDAALAARTALADALAALKPRQRVALALRYVHDLSDAEIAEALDCRPGTVHALLSRGRSALRSNEQLTALAAELSIGGTR